MTPAPLLESAHGGVNPPRHPDGLDVSRPTQKLIRTSRIYSVLLSLSARDDVDERSKAAHGTTSALPLENSPEHHNAQAVRPAPLGREVSEVHGLHGGCSGVQGEVLGLEGPI